MYTDFFDMIYHPVAYLQQDLQDGKDFFCDNFGAAFC